MKPGSSAEHSAEHSDELAVCCYLVAMLLPQPYVLVQKGMNMGATSAVAAAGKSFWQGRSAVLQLLCLLLYSPVSVSTTMLTLLLVGKGSICTRVQYHVC
jgi:hypothetical protein